VSETWASFLWISFSCLSPISSGFLRLWLSIYHLHVISYSPSCHVLNCSIPNKRFWF
jgi:hypothetical protein